MSGVSSSRARTKKSELAQFFRGYPSRQPSKNEAVESPRLSVPADAECTTPKKSKLPFLYRTRKKSTPSVKSGIFQSTGRGYESEATELPMAATATTTKKDRRLSYPIPSPEPTIKKGTLPTVKAVPQINVTSPSLGSKFVAHFSNSKLRKAPSSQSTMASSDGNPTDSLFSPVDTRTTSIHSTAAASTIPPSKPGNAVITIASAPDNLEAYSNIYTLSQAKKTTITRRLPSTPASQYRDNYNKTEPSVPSIPSSPSLSRLPSSPSSIGSRLSNSSRNETREQDFRRLNDGSKSLKLSKRAPGPKLAENSPAEDSADESVLHLRPGNLTQTIDVTLTPAPIQAASPTPRHRLRTSSAIKDARTTDPPSIPLPDPPAMKNSPPTSPTSPSSPRSPVVLPSPSIITRPRANTTGSVPLSLVTAAAITSRASSPKQSPKLCGENHVVKKSLNKESSDLDGMTVGQLKEALAQRNQQYAELTTHLLEVTKSHAVEKAVLEKKITALITEVARKDKEIQGFTWMLNNRGTQSTPDDDVDYTRIPGPRIQRSSSAASSKLSSRRIQQGDDSGAESPSGGESVPGSGGSVRLKRGLRPLTLGDSSYYRSSISSKASSRGPAFDSGLSDQRTSVYSLSSSAATSSSSSLLPPSPSLSHPFLSAIPEVSVVTSSRVALPRISTFRTCDSTSECETEPEKKCHDVRPSNRVSASSFSSSSSSSATSAYAANLKRGRPPSIAQVLHKSGTIDDVLEKLRPFAAAPTAAEA